MKKLNLPNKLTVLRLCMVPVFILVMYFIPNEYWLYRNLIGAVLFIATSLTDMLDGRIARKYNLVTDFGKFLDPLADKFLVIGAMTMILYLPQYSNIHAYFIFVYIIVLFREFAVTGLRLLVNSKGKVMAAGKLGKIKTVFQMSFIISALLEPILYELLPVAKSSLLHLYPPITLFFMVGVLVFTVWSALSYFGTSGKYIDPEK